MESLLRPLTILAALCLCTAAHADSVRLKDGTRISGKATK